MIYLLFCKEDLYLNFWIYLNGIEKMIIFGNVEHITFIVSVVEFNFLD